MSWLKVLVKTQKFRRAVKIRLNYSYFTNYSIQRPKYYIGYQNNLGAYSGTIDYYLKRVFSTFTSLADRVAAKNAVEFKEDYKKIGYFYKGTNK